MNDTQSIELAQPPGHVPRRLVVDFDIYNGPHHCPGR
jgi:hypothetical protein